MGCNEGRLALLKAGKALTNAALAQARADQAYQLAIGLVYVVNDYQTLVTELNAAEPSLFTLGATIYVKTKEVPDLWFASIAEDTSVPYTYTTDAQFIADLKTNPNGLQIGYYKVCEEEGMKIDMPAVLYESQTLTDAQKAVARGNIGAIVVSDIPAATPSVLGLVKSNPNTGINTTSDGTLTIYKASDAEIEAKTNTFKPIVPSNLQKAVDVGVKGSANYTSYTCEMSDGTTKTLKIYSELN